MKLSSTVKLRAGRTMPIIGLGTWKLSRDTAGTIAEALKLGYPMIDTSGDYGTQPGIGLGIKKSGIDRKNFYLTTKVEAEDEAYDRVKQNLAELGLDYADLMLIHWPPKREETGINLWKGLIRARDEGLVFDIGVSNYSTRLIEQLYKMTGEMPAVNQIEWTPFGHSQHMLDFCKTQGIVIQAYSPIMRGNHLDNSALLDIAKKYNKTSAQVVLRWNIQLGVVPLPKANSAEHLKENIDLFDFELSSEDMGKINDLNEQRTLMWWQQKLPYL